jgi:deoxyribonuclease I
VRTGRLTRRFGALLALMLAGGASCDAGVPAPSRNADSASTAVRSRPVPAAPRQPTTPRPGSSAPAAGVDGDDSDAAEPADAGGSAQAGNTQVQSFEKAKRTLAREINADHRITIYCGCAYSATGRMDFTGCGYVPKQDEERAHRLEWEHVVPAEAFGQSFPEWRDGSPECVNSKGHEFKGRECARKASVAFRYMEADMYNLYPEIGELNALRSNLPMGELQDETHSFGRCDVKLSDGAFEPRPEVRGDVARTYLYMNAAYPKRGIISRKNKKLFAAWSEMDPVDGWECERARRIEKAQGNVNQLVAALCRKAGL